MFQLAQRDEQVQKQQQHIQDLQQTIEDLMEELQDQHHLIPSTPPSPASASTSMNLADFSGMGDLSLMQELERCLLKLESEKNETQQDVGGQVAAVVDKRDILDEVGILSPPPSRPATPSPKPSSTSQHDECEVIQLVNIIESSSMNVAPVLTSPSTTSTSAQVIDLLTSLRTRLVEQGLKPEGNRKARKRRLYKHVSKLRKKGMLGHDLDLVHESGREHENEVVELEEGSPVALKSDEVKIGGSDEGQKSKNKKKNKKKKKSSKAQDEGVILCNE
jgi:hypothetical protein